MSPLGSNEDRLIRIPLTLRNALDIKTGSFLYLKSKNDSLLPLQVAVSYSNDAIKDDSCGYVSRDTYDQLLIKKEYIDSCIKPADNVLVGADPEFFLIDRVTGGNISASHFFHHYGDVGSDCGLAELRPRPGFSEHELVSNLNELLNKAYKHLSNRTLFKNRKMDMIAASMLNGAAAGFHVHFGLPTMLLTGTPQSHQVLRRMVDVLDYYIGIPSILPEGSEDFRRRSDKYSKYGKPGDYRSDSLTLEYRVPGGHLLRHPILSKGLFAISIVVMKDILSRFKIYSNDYKDFFKLRDYNSLLDMYPKLPGRKEIYESVVSNDTKRAIFHTISIMKDISKMIGYEERSKSITDYFDYILSYLEYNKKFSGDIKENWRLRNEGQS
jgi:hypothetical protein